MERPVKTSQSHHSSEKELSEMKKRAQINLCSMSKRGLKG
jgi:hypothetical protein